MSEILQALSTLHDNGLAVKDCVDIASTLLDADDLEDSDDVKRLTLFVHLDGEDFDIDCEAYDDCTFEVGGGTYLVCTEDEKGSRWDDALENYLDECVEGADGPYFDREAWKRDARMDGAGHALSSYDGGEAEHCVGAGWFFIFRIN